MTRPVRSAHNLGMSTIDRQASLAATKAVRAERRASRAAKVAS